MRQSFDTIRVLKSIGLLIGNTPLFAIHFKYRGQYRKIYAKAEFMNFTGSIKDRMALHVIKAAYSSGALRRGDKIVEATSGNTGISFAAIGRALGHPVLIYMPDWMSNERSLLIKAMGAQVELVSKDRGGFIGSIDCCEELGRTQPNIFLPRQFSNAANVEAHQLGTGPEIVAQIANLGLNVDAFVAGVGTGGTVMGVGGILRDRFPAAIIHPLEPAESPTLSTGFKVGHHRIQGISDDFIPPICQLKSLDSIIAVRDGDAILMAQKLASVLGLGVGISSGANFLGAIEAQDRLGIESTVVTIFCDDNKKYLSTALMRDEPVHSAYRAPEVDLVAYEALARAV